MNANTNAFTAATSQPLEQHSALIQELDELHSLLTQLPDASQSLHLLQQIRNQVQHNRLTILLYGNYNAGKSSLINLLLGREVAPVADIPTTNQLCEYEWRGIRLLDSPGINAPIAHQQISQAQLDKSDLVLFVIRSGDVDEASLFGEMARLLTANKQLCILLNCDSSEPETVQRWQSRLDSNLLTHLLAAGISEHVLRTIPLLPVNLLTARRARDLDQAPLLAASGFPLIESRLIHWARQQWQKAAWLSSLFNRLDQQVLQPLLQGDNGSSALQVLEQRQQTLEASERQLQTLAIAQLMSELQGLRPRLQRVLELPQDEVHAAVTHEIEAMTERLQTWLSSRHGALPENTLRAWAQLQKSPEFGPENNLMAEIYQQLQGLLTPEHIQSMLQKGQQMGLPWLKQMGKDSLGQLGRRLNVGLRLLTTGWEYYAAGRDEVKARAQAQQQALQHHQRLEAIIEHLRAQLQEQLQQMITLLFAPQRQALLEERATRLAQCSTCERQQQQLHLLRNRLEKRCHPEG